MALTNEEIRKRLDDELGPHPAMPPEKAYETLQLYDEVNHQCFSMKMGYTIGPGIEGDRKSKWHSMVQCVFETPPYPPGKCVEKWFTGDNHLDALQKAKKWIDENVVLGELTPEALTKFKR